MVMVNFIIKMEVCMMGSGGKIKWKVLANCIINLGNLHMREIGGMISLWAKEYSIIKSLMS